MAMDWKRLWQRVRDALQRGIGRLRATFGSAPTTAPAADANRAQPGARAEDIRHAPAAPAADTTTIHGAGPATGDEAVAAVSDTVSDTDSDTVSDTDSARVAATTPATDRPFGSQRWIRDAIMTSNGQMDLVPWALPQRAYRIHEPATLAANPSVLVMLHGCRQTPEDIAEGPRLNEHADARGWLVVYPDQSETANKYRCWNWFDPANQRGDGECALVVAMLAAVRARYDVPDAPAFLSGMSAGGALASLLAVRFPSLWSGVAIHSGLPFGAAADPWGAMRVMREGPDSLDAVRALTLEPGGPDRAVDPGRAVEPGRHVEPVPAMIFHGAADTVVDRRNADLLVRQFLGWNGHLPAETAWDDAPLPAADVRLLSAVGGHNYILREYARNGLAPVRECEVIEMSHAWSGGDSALPYNDELGPDGTALMLEFFAERAEPEQRTMVPVH